MVASLDYISPLISGIIVALTSWFPIGSGGYAVSRLLEAVAPVYGDYLVPSYMGVIFAVLFYFKDLIGPDTQKALVGRFSSTIKYFVYAAIFTVLVGYPLARGLGGSLGPRTSDLVNAVIGAGLVVVGVIYWKHLRAPLEDVEERVREDEEDTTLIDALISGVAQGVALIGGISNVGLVLLGLSSTGINIKKALELTFVVAPIYLTMKLLFMGGGSPELPVSLLFTAFVASFITSILTMRALLKAAEALGRETFLVLFGSVSIIVCLMGVII
ncbi:undecaprenyl-diphosphate phosphatase [Thermococcus pacificus]|uniref:Undecaprenyl-diphosphatase n=1 Tax=Thermococcus pacificus TaxID=71998 RepID=A0A218P7R2_9EURY|nr:undecaprenyl-diphosphate phosphatase [Thermococcus pacificus]ASJ06809.1 bacilysin biosynthesis protein BacA [Thermococcus pacificus]